MAEASGKSWCFKIGNVKNLRRNILDGGSSVSKSTESKHHGTASPGNRRQPVGREFQFQDQNQGLQHRCPDVLSVLRSKAGRGAGPGGATGKASGGGRGARGVLANA